MAEVLKQSEWITHDGSAQSPVADDVLIGDCDMGRNGIYLGNPIRAKTIYWKGVKRYRTLVPNA